MSSSSAFAQADVRRLAERVEALAQTVEEQGERIEELEETVEEEKERADRAEAVAEAAISHTRQQWERIENETGRINDVTIRTFENHEGRIQDLEHDRVDVADLVNADASDHDLSIQRKTASRLEAEREDREHGLTGNKYRMTFLWREFITSATKTKGGGLKLDSSACKVALERKTEEVDPNPNTVQRAMKQLARHTRTDGGVSDPGHAGDEANLVRFEPGEQGGEKATLRADAEEFREFCADHARAATEEIDE